MDVWQTYENMTSNQKIRELHLLLEKRGDQSANLTATERKALTLLCDWYDETQNPV